MDILEGIFKFFRYNSVCGKKMHKSDSPFVIRIDIPALTAYVDYLQGSQQQSIDALTKTVKDLTVRLKEASTSLKQEVDETKGEQT